MTTYKAIGIIPARYGSTRLKAKMLLDLAGKPVLQHVYEAAARSKLERVIIATDDERIKSAAEGFGAECVMTPASCPSGSDRVAAACRDIDTQIVVNIQGDEPFIRPDSIDRAVDILLADPKAVVGTLAFKTTDPEDVNSPDKVKTIIDNSSRAIYFSRSPIPFVRDKEQAGTQEYLIHMGLYAFRKDFLLRFVQMEPSRLEQLEKLEQLRIIENGYSITLALTDNRGFGIDTQEDLNRAARILWQSTSS